MKRILATTALVALTAVPAFAQTEPTAPGATVTQTESFGGGMEMNGMRISADELIGRTVYVSSVDGADTTTGMDATTDTGATGGTTAGDSAMGGMDAPADDWENAGSINDVIFSADGNIEAVVLDVGGFLGIGSRQVSTSMDELTLINDTSSDGEFFVVFNGSPAELEERPELDRDGMNQQGSTFHSTDGGMVGDGVGTDMQQDPTGTGAAAPEAPTDLQDTAPATGTADLAQDGMQDPAVPAQDFTQEPGGVQDDRPFLEGDARTALTADELMGTNVHDMADENVGSITDIVLTDDGEVSAVIVDVGGFLGIGARSVALEFDDLQFSYDDGAMTTSLRAYTQLTAGEIEAMPEWDNN